MKPNNEKQDYLHFAKWTKSPKAYRNYHSFFYSKTTSTFLSEEIDARQTVLSRTLSST